MVNQPFCYLHNAIKDSRYANNLLNYDSEVWLTGMRDYSVKTPKLYSTKFMEECDQLLLDFYGISQQSLITPINYEQIYSFIVQNY